MKGCNKILRNIRTNISRKTSQKDNLVDIIKRMWISSDPVVNQERYKTQTVCKMCKTASHSIRSCKSVRATAPTEDDYLFKSLLL